MLGLLLALLASFLFPLAASAHPLGNFTINRYSRIEVGPERVTVRYVLDLAEIPTLQELQAAGVTAAISDAQREALLRRFGALVLDGARLSIGGTAVGLVQRGATLELLPGEAGLQTMRMVFELAGDVRIADGAALRYQDGTFVDRIGWREVVLRAGRGVRLEAASVPSDDQTDELRRYPTDPLRPPLAVTVAAATLRLAPGEGGTAGAEPGGGAARVGVAGLFQGVSDLVQAGARGDFVATVLSVLAAVGLGAFHALTPGHGKTVMAAYLVGTRGSARQALGLGAAVAVSHTFGVLILALLILGASAALPPERFFPYLSALSALIVLGIGVWLLVGALRARAHGRGHDHDHDHGHGHGHDHGHGHGHGHGHAPATVGWRGLVALGVSGGIVPSASALLLLLATVSLRRPDLGLALIIAFGVGMAVVLVGIGLVLVRAGELAASRMGNASLMRRVVPLLPLGTAAVVLLVGAWLSLQAGYQLFATL